MRPLWGMGYKESLLFIIIAHESLSQKILEKERQSYYFRLRLPCATDHVGKPADMEGYK